MYPSEKSISFRDQQGGPLSKNIVFSIITPWCYYRKNLISSEPHYFFDFFVRIMVNFSLKDIVTNQKLLNIMFFPTNNAFFTNNVKNLEKNLIF